MSGEYQIYLGCMAKYGEGNQNPSYLLSQLNSTNKVEGVNENSRTDGEYGLGDPHDRGELHASNKTSQADRDARPGTNPRVAEHLKELTSIKP